MKLKRCFLFILLFILAFSLFSPIVAECAVVDVGDGYITIDNGQITMTGPQMMNSQEEAMGTVIEKYKAVITFVSGIITVTMVAIFIIQFLKLGMVTSNPRDRKEVLIGLLISGFSAALMGSVTLFVGVFYGMLK